MSDLVGSIEGEVPGPPELECTEHAGSASAIFVGRQGLRVGAGTHNSVIAVPVNKGNVLVVLRVAPAAEDEQEWRALRAETHDAEGVEAEPRRQQLGDEVRAVADAARAVARPEERHQLPNACGYACASSGRGHCRCS